MRGLGPVKPSGGVCESPALAERRPHAARLADVGVHQVGGGQAPQGVQEACHVGGHVGGRWGRGHPGGLQEIPRQVEMVGGGAVGGGGGEARDGCEGRASHCSHRTEPSEK